LSIHPTAIVSDRAQISPSASIGPYCVIAGDVTVGAHTTVESHVRIGSEFGEVVIGEIWAACPDEHGGKTRINAKAVAAKIVKTLNEVGGTP